MRSEVRYRIVCGLQSRVTQRRRAPGPTQKSLEEGSTIQASRTTWYEYHDSFVPSLVVNPSRACAFNRDQERWRVNRRDGLVGSPLPFSRHQKPGYAADPRPTPAPSDWLRVDTRPRPGLAIH